MFKKWMGLCVLMFLVLLMAFALPAMANKTGGAPPGDIVAMIDIETVTGAMLSIAGQDEPANTNMLKDRTSEPTDWGTSLSPIACGNNGLQHGHPGGVSMALT